MNTILATSESGYWSRKHAELSLLSRHAEPQLAESLFQLPTDLEQLASIRKQLRSRVISRQIAWSAQLPETSEGGRTVIDTPAGTMSYSYQRYDLRRIECSWLQEVYRFSSVPVASDGLFVASGMSAVAAVVSAVSRMDGRHLEISADPYFEVPWLLRRLYPSIKFVETTEFSDTADVVWIDTVSSSFPDLPARPPRLIVIDTSCVELDSPRIGRWLADATSLGTPAVLVRSHIKLDSFGLEIGRLGSVVVTGVPGQVETIARLVREAVSLQGMNFLLHATYPWLGDPIFLALARERTEAIRRSTRRIAAALDEAGVPVKRRPHETSVVLDLPIGNPSPANTIAARVVARTRAAGGAAVVAASFGLDNLAVQDYVDLRDGKPYLRLCGADLPSDASDRFLADAVAEEFQ